MNGATLKKVIVSHALSQSSIASSIGYSQQALSAALKSDDIKSSLIEKISAATGIRISEIYGETPDGNTAQAIGTNNTAVAGSDIRLNSQIEILTNQLHEKDAQINKLLELLKK